MTDNINEMRVLYFLIIFVFLGCETKEYYEPPSPPEVVNASDSLFGSTLSFQGLQSVTSVTDTSAILNWTDIEGAKEYYIYTTTSGIIQFRDRVEAPASAYAATKLLSGETYSFMVRVKDEDAQLDNNFNSITITTNATPDEPTSFDLNTNNATADITLYNDVIDQPTFIVSGTREGDTVELYTDSSCSATNKVGEAVAETASVFVTSDKLSAYGTYNFYMKLINVNGVETDCIDSSDTSSASDSSQYEFLECPIGYVKVDLSAGNQYGLNDFCVMQFEAKAWYDADFDGDPEILSDFFGQAGCQENDCTTKNWGSFYQPASVNSSIFNEVYPWRMLDIQTAKDECRSLGEGYDLINIYEWMAIANDLEANEANWFDVDDDDEGDIGDAAGCLFRGNNGLDDDCGYNYGGIDPRDIASRDEEAQFELSSGDMIYDFAGNVDEWVDFGVITTQDEVTLGPEFCDDTWSEFGTDYLCDYDLDLELDLEEYFYIPGNPANVTTADYNSDYGLGMFEGGRGGATTRGGSYRYGTYAGMYSISFARSDEDASEEIGFRCVFRPYE